MKKELYYLQDSRKFSGNDMLWWGKRGCGYVTDLSKAQTYTRAEAELQNATRETDIPWPVEYAEGKARKALDSQDANLETALTGRNFKLKKPAKKPYTPGPRYQCPTCGKFISESNYFNGPYNGSSCSRCERGY